MTLILSGNRRSATIWTPRGRQLIPEGPPFPPAEKKTNA
jgi:hypothetical protein